MKNLDSQEIVSNRLSDGQVLIEAALPPEAKPKDKLTAMKEVHKYVLAKLKAPLNETGDERTENGQLPLLLEM